MNDIWSWNNAVDAAGTTIESSAGSAGELVASNIRDPRVAKIWRSGGMPVTLTINLPASAGVSIVGLFHANFSDVGSVSVSLEASAGSVWAATAPATGDRVVFLIRDGTGELAPVSASRLVISASGTAPLEIGRVWVGGADWLPSVGHTIGSSKQVVDLSQVRRTPVAGARLVDRGNRLRKFTAEYDALVLEEYDEIMDRIDLERGLAAQILFIPRPDVYSLERAPILGGLVELSETRFVGFLRGARTLTIQEDG